MQLRRTAQRRAAFRLRLALEALALAVALALALAASVVSSPHGLDRARSWLYRRGFGAPPALPLARPGEPVAALAPIAKGAILECEGGALAYAFAGEAALRSGDALLLGPDQRAHLMLAAGGQIVAQGPCRIELESGGGALRIALESGTFWCSLPLSEAPVRFRVPGGEFDANGMEFALRAGPAAELSRLDPETKPGAAPAIPGALAAQIAIAAGRLRLGDSLAMMGETVALEEGQAPHRRDTPFRDPLVGFGQTAAQEPTFAAVERIESLKAQLKSALATEMLESLHQAVAETDLRVFFEAFIECPDTEASWYRRQLKRQIDWVAGLRIVSARQAGDRVVVRTRGAGRSAALARLVFEQRPDEKDNGKPRWTLVRFFGPGSCFDPSEAGKGEEPGDPQFDDTNPPSEIPPYEGEGKPGSIA
ncbi:MAG: hypothetical protein BWZ10_02175 [candidate division BRC1 bacterium ADurb.BinA364]|nr:MAG: hypothetical protein BWZ10_02175 [candidate division BRC1 bacterium ADurb.BinA364]